MKRKDSLKHIRIFEVNRVHNHLHPWHNIYRELCESPHKVERIGNGCLPTYLWFQPHVLE